MSRSFRKPDGTTTLDPREYGEAWRALGEQVEKLFPGYVVYGYDPDIVLVDLSRHDSFSLPVGAVRALLQGMKK